MRVTRRSILAFLALALSAPAALGQGSPWWAGQSFVTNPSVTGGGGGTTKPTLDVFFVIGDSNAVGEGNSAQSPTPPSTALMYCANGTIAVAADPTCSAVTAAQNANTGSQWPSVAIAYGRPIGFVLTGVGGSTQASACDFHTGNGNWQDTTPGSNVANALAAINAALAAYANAGYAPVFRGIIASLGGNDASNINASVCTQAQYTAAYTAMAAYWRSVSIGGKVYPNLPIYQLQAGTNSLLAGADGPGFPQVRSAQIANAAADGNTLLVNVDLASFYARGLLQVNQQHPTQAGYNQWGTEIGGALIPFVQQNIPFRVFNQNTAAAPLPRTGTVLQVVGADNAFGQVLMDGFGTSFPAFLTRSAGGTGAAPSAVTSGSNLGGFLMQGYGTTGYSGPNNAGMLCNATQTFTDTAHGTSCTLYATTIGNNGPTQSLMVNPGTITLGGLDTAAPPAQTLNAQGVLTGTSNTAGANLTIAGSRGTGTGVGGTIQLQVAPAGGAGSTQNALVPQMTVLGNGNIGFGTETNPQFPFVVSQNTTTGFNLTPGLNGITLVGATGTIPGYNAIGINSFGNNQFVRINNTISSPQNVNNADIVAGFGFGGWGGGALQNGRAQIIVGATEAWSGTTFGSYMQFNMVPVGTNSRAQSFMLPGAGVIVGTATATNDPGTGALNLTPQTVGTLKTCSATIKGSIASVSDGDAGLAWGATAVHTTGTSSYLVYCNGSAWTVAGK